MVTLSPQLTKAPRHTLSEATASALWEHLLTRQGLGPGNRLSSAVQIADAALGLHAARLPSPYGIVASRSTDPAVPATLFTRPVRARLLTVRCMRKTLHTLPLHLATAAHAATLRFRARDARRAVTNAGITPGELTRSIDQLLSVLQTGAQHHRAIETRLADHGIPIPLARLALKTAWENGQIVYTNATTSWNREARTFDLPSAAYPNLNLDLDPDIAATRLVEAYFDRYGPATIRDATWWSGLPASDITTALTSTGRQIVRVHTPWADADAVMFADRLEEFHAADPAPTGVNLLAHEDTALKAYYQTRPRYLGDLPQQRAFNQIGEALPTVIAGGKITGTWRWDPAQRAVVLSLVRGRLTAPQRRQARLAADQLTTTLRQAWSATTTGHHDGEKLSLTSTDE